MKRHNKVRKKLVGQKKNYRYNDIKINLPEKKRSQDVKNNFIG